MTSVTIRIPENVIDDLKLRAPVVGFSGYQPLIRAHIGQGIRKDLRKVEADKVTSLIESLKRHGVSDKINEDAIREADGSRLC